MGEFTDHANNVRPTIYKTGPAGDENNGNFHASRKICAKGIPDVIPSDCVYVPGKGGDTEGWVDVECRDYNGTACDRNGSGQGRMYQTRSVQSDAVGDGVECGALTRGDGPPCLYNSCAPLDCEYRYIDATPTVCTPKENVCVPGHSNYQKGENYNSDT